MQQAYSDAPIVGHQMSTNTRRNRKWIVGFLLSRCARSIEPCALLRAVDSRTACSNGRTATGRDVSDHSDTINVTVEHCKWMDNFTAAYPVDRWEVEGWFDRQHDLLDINCYWMEFAPVRPSVHFGLAILYVIFFVVGFCSNALVIYTVLRSVPAAFL